MLGDSSHGLPRSPRGQGGAGSDRGQEVPAGLCRFLDCWLSGGSFLVAFPGAVSCHNMASVPIKFTEATSPGRGAQEESKSEDPQRSPERRGASLKKMKLDCEQPH